jgi:ABC-type phosphate transport system substrate-binding protein
MSRRTSYLVVFLIGVLAASPCALAQQELGFQVIVHRSNPIESLGREQISRLFLKEEIEWSSGAPVDPIELVPGSRVREEFSTEIHGRDVKAIEAHWQRKIFQGEGVPPVTTSSERDVVGFVTANPNAIGYVSKETVVDARVKVVTITD